MRKEDSKLSIKGKKLLVLGGAGVHCKVVEAAKAMGVYTIVADYLPVQDSPAKQIADENVLISILDVDAIVEYCKQNHIDGVINFCNDPAQKAHQQICERLGLPCYGNADQVLKLTNKQEFKKMCMENGVDIIPTYQEDELLAHKVSYPVMVKPVDSRGSRGVVVCKNYEEAVVALAKAKKESSNGKAIIEKYMGGKQDFSMTYIFINGEAHLIRTADRFLGNVADGLGRQCICSISPSRQSKMYKSNVDTRVVKMLQNLGIQNAPVFMQGFIDGDTVRFYDPGIRFPGADYEKLFAKATGINPMKIMVTYALTGVMGSYEGDLQEGYRLAGKCSIQLLICARQGKIATFEGLEKIAELPEVVSIAQKAFVGEEIPASGDVKQRICEVVILVENKTCIIKDIIKKVQSMLVVQDEDGTNMLISQFDTNCL